MNAAWVRGFCTALADMHRMLVQGFGGSEIMATCKAASVDLATARKSGVSDYDLRELRRAGVR